MTKTHPIRRLLLAATLSAGLLSTPALAQENFEPQSTASSPRFSLGLNVAELAIFYGVGAMLNADNPDGGVFVPLHFNGTYVLDPHWGLDWGLVYRRDTHGTFLNYNEWIGLVGPRYNWSGTGLSGAYTSLRAGYGHAEGNVNSLEEELYSCSELAVQPEVGDAFPLGKSNHFHASASVGMLFLVPTSCQNEVEWSTLGIFVHRAVPVANFTLAFSL